MTLRRQAYHGNGETFFMVAPHSRKQWRVVITSLFIFLSVSHAVSGFFIPGFPAWTMFRNADRYSYSLFDRLGNSIRIRDHVQPRSYVICDQNNVYLIARWLAEREPRRMPMWGSVTNWTGGHSTSTPPTTVEFKVLSGGAAPPLISIVSRTPAQESASEKVRP